MALLALMSQARAARRTAVRDRPDVATDDRWPIVTAIIVWSLVSAVAWGGAIAAAIAVF
jgi:hypothetical protein